MVAALRSDPQRRLSQSTRGGRTLSNDEKVILRGKIITLVKEAATLPDGRVREYEVARHPGGAVALAVDGDLGVCLLRQYRPAVGEWIWEAPAGKFDVPGEAPLDTARRELAEEAGLAASEWTELGSILTSPGFCDERLHLYLARELTLVDTSHGPGEVIEIHWFPLVQALKMAALGEISDAKTVVALLRTWARFFADEPLNGPDAGGSVGHGHS